MLPRLQQATDLIQHVHLRAGEAGAVRTTSERARRRCGFLRTSRDGRLFKSAAEIAFFSEPPRGRRRRRRERETLRRPLFVLSYPPRCSSRRASCRWKTLNRFPSSGTSSPALSPEERAAIASRDGRGDCADRLQGGAGGTGRELEETALYSSRESLFVHRDGRRCN